MVVGQTHDQWLKEGIAQYEKRMNRYWPFALQVIPDVKGGGKLPPEQLKTAEGKAILKHLQPSDELILLDEKGKEMHSEKLAQWFQKKANAGLKNLVLLVGGAYGFSPEIYQKARGKLALSQLTFSHQMVRLFAIEQIYRSMTILHGEPYHHA